MRNLFIQGSAEKSVHPETEMDDDDDWAGRKKTFVLGFARAARKKNYINKGVWKENPMCMCVLLLLLFLNR